MSTPGDQNCATCADDGSNRVDIRLSCNSYNERLKSIIQGSNKDFSPLDIGCPHKCLLDCGLPNLPIQVSVKTITSKVVQENHPFKLIDILHLPEYICQPIAIFRSATSAEDVKVILTEMEANGVNIVVVINPAKSFKGLTVNSIRSIYPKDNIKPVLEWICNHKLMEYCDKQKILKWFDKHQYNPGDVIKLLKDCTKLINKT